MTIDIVQLSVFAVEKGAEMPLDEDDEYFAIDRTTSQARSILEGDGDYPVAEGDQYVVRVHAFPYTHIAESLAVWGPLDVFSDISGVLKAIFDREFEGVEPGTERLVTALLDIDPEEYTFIGVLDLTRMPMNNHDSTTVYQIAPVDTDHA